MSDIPASSLPFSADHLLGTSPWVTIDQEMIDAFGRATLDPDPMHDDPAWARTSSPFGGTIAYGFLTMSLLSHLLRSFVGRDETALGGHFLNYGFDRLRLIAPVPSGSRVRGHFQVKNVQEESRKTMVTLSVSVECDQSDRPALVADWLCVYVPATSKAS